MDYRYIYIVFSKTGTWLSRAIKVFSDSKYVHASISFDLSFKAMYSFGRTNPDNPFSGGFVEENLFGGVYKKYSSSECLIYKVRVTDEQYKFLLKEIEEFIKEKQKYRYNFLGLFGVLVNKPVKRKYYYFCSQFVSELLMKCDIYDSCKRPELIRPNELFSIDNKEVIYEGAINEYNILKEVYSFN